MSAREVPLGPAGTAVSRAFLKRGAFSQPSFLGVWRWGGAGGVRVCMCLSLRVSPLLFLSPLSLLFSQSPLQLEIGGQQMNCEQAVCSRSIFPELKRAGH